MPLSNPEQISNVANLQATLDSLQNQVHPGYASGRYYFSHCYLGTTYSSFTASYIFYTYFYVAKTQRFDRILSYINTAGAAGSTARLGIYSVAVGSPQVLILDTGNIAIDTTGAKEVIIDVTLSPGWYAFAYLSTSSTALIFAAASNSTGAGFIGVPSFTSNPSLAVRSTTTVVGALPANASAVTILAGSYSPFLYLRAA